LLSAEDRRRFENQISKTSLQNWHVISSVVDPLKIEFPVEHHLHAAVALHLGEKKNCGNLFLQKNRFGMHLKG
jgi:hypothetical protein